MAAKGSVASIRKKLVSKLSSSDERRRSAGGSRAPPPVQTISSDAVRSTEPPPPPASVVATTNWKNQDCRQPHHQTKIDRLRNGQNGYTCRYGQFPVIGAFALRSVAAAVGGVTVCEGVA